MTITYAHTADKENISLNDLPASATPPRTREPVPLTTRGSRQDPDGLVFLPKVPTGTQIAENSPEPKWDLYPVEEVQTPVPGNRTPEYYIQDFVLSFEGELGTRTAKVLRTVTWTQRPIDELLQLKLSEIDTEKNRALYQGVQVQGMVVSGTVWMKSGATDWRQSDAIFTQDVLPGQTQFTLFDIWDRPFIFVKADMGNYSIAIALADATTNSNAAGLSNAALERHREGDWEGLADIDPNAGWPEGPPSEPTALRVLLTAEQVAQGLERIANRLEETAAQIRVPKRRDGSLG